MPRKTLSKRLPPSSTGDAALDAAINTEIALFNRSGNMLALWAVLGMCARLGIRLPEEVDEKFAAIAEQLLGYAKQGEQRAREAVADIVLGTRNVMGGRSVFQEYALLKRNAAIVARVFKLLMLDLDDLQIGKKVRPGRQSRKGRVRRTASVLGSKAKTRSEIYEEVAAEYEVDPATVKRLFEKDEREAGPFSYRALQQKPGADGTIDL